MALDDTDRRRFLLAAVVTVIALPALWWINREDGSNRPSTATVGVEIDGASDGSTEPADTVATIESTIGRSNLPTEPTILGLPPIFLDGPAPQPGGIPQIAVPNPDANETILTRATFGEFPGTGCLARNIETGQEITVVNLDNNRTITCRVTLAPATQTNDLVLLTDQFTQLADLTDAPIPVQIRL